MLIARQIAPGVGQRCLVFRQLPLRLRQLHLPEVYGVTENPLPWLQALLSGVEHANFFEARATEYSKAATQGNWHGVDGVWTEFDRMMARRDMSLVIG